MQKNWSYVGAALVSFAIGGCVSSEWDGAAGPDLEASEGVETVVAQPFIDKAGRKWVPTRKIARFQDEQPSPPDSNEPEPDLTRMTIEELAEHFRPISEFNGVEYTLEQPDYEFAERVRERMLARAAGTLPEEVRASNMPDQGTIVENPALGREGRDVFSPDSRVQISHTSQFAWPIAINTAVWCTFTKVGPDTVITAAHCVHNGSNWLGKGDLRFGARWSAADQFATLPGCPAGTTTNCGCYTRTVPACWDGDSASCDYAVLNISDDGGRWCPQVNTGWYGLSTSLTTSTKYLYGYPSTTDQRPAGLGVTWNYPQLFGVSETTFTSFTYPDRVFYDHDASLGQSGSGLWRFSGSDKVIVAIHKGAHCGLSCSNQGRDIDSDLIDWFDANGGDLGAAP